MSQPLPVSRRTLLQGAGATALLALLAACGSDDESGSTGGSVHFKFSEIERRSAMLQFVE